ncbi:type I-E CRISPR-associated protein Cse2/CasB [Streptomyces sp. RM72]|uniref:type I-E CRISPR-associated protein Cse2/CasB n=1 Tax=Streptomyces sp. RM72 TaxID=1115510 RepID=UPI001B36E5DB|nr:type I-E CRISPR-associated protein Cse2/CasB [Streptomyces sp. RM72]MBQ0888614.1 type I-E CRISPR-associated protein Cse2/CasB [Streptomyces sp. RM72]
MTTPAPQRTSRPEDAVRDVTDRLLTGLQARLARAIDRGEKAMLSRNDPPGDPGLWLSLRLEDLHGSTGPGLSEQDYVAAATAVTAAAQLWARTDIPHARSTAQRVTLLGHVVARIARDRPAAEDDLARALRCHTLDELLPRLRPLLRDATRLDFAQLAADLYTWQQPDGPHRTTQQWATAYARAKNRAHRAPTPRP